MKHNVDTGHLIVNLHELHDILTNLSSLGLTRIAEGLDEFLVRIAREGNVVSIGIIDDKLSTEEGIKWMHKMQELIIMLNDLDCAFHDDFGCYDGVEFKREK